MFTTGRRVLVVEDFPDRRESLRLLLAALGHEVRTAEDGRSGVEVGLTWRPNAAVVDINLPYLDGYEVARRLRVALGARFLLIALTAHGQPGDEERSLRAGFDHHLVKPVEPATLASLLAQAPAEE